jgi:hypothetical protein
MTMVATIPADFNEMRLGGMLPVALSRFADVPSPGLSVTVDDSGEISATASVVEVKDAVVWLQVLFGTLKIRAA